MLKSFAGIFAGGDVGAEIFFGQGNPQILGRRVKRCGGRIETQLESAGVRICVGDGGEEEARFGMSGGPADLVAGFASAIADELGAAVDDHLGRVDAAVGKRDGILFLTAGKISGGERVGPAERIPVIDMLFERKNFDAVKRLFVGEFFEQGIGGRATGAAFGSEKFDDDGLAGGGVGGRFGGGGGVRGPVEEDEQGSDGYREKSEEKRERFEAHDGPLHSVREEKWEKVTEGEDGAEEVRGGRAESWLSEHRREIPHSADFVRNDGLRLCGRGDAG